MRRFSYLLALLVTIALTPSNAPSCGPISYIPLFTTTRVPDVPDADFQSGKLGIVRGELNTEYLVVAYRYLQGAPLTAKAAKTPAASDTPPPSATDIWMKARNAVAPAKQVAFLNPYRTKLGSEYGFFANCLDDAFRTAAQTLESRAKTFGPKHPGVQAWIGAQDTVFTNCNEGEAVPAAPDKLLPAVLAADRRYQIAAANFYATRYAEARTLFQEIAAEKDSPWRHVAPYLAARTYIREAAIKDKPDTAVLANAEQILLDLSKRSPDPGVRNASARLADYLAAKLHPNDRLAAIGAKLADSKFDDQFRANLSDFEYMERTAKEGLRPGGNDLTDWILAMRGKMDADHVRAKWTKGGSDAWLLAMLETDPKNSSAMEAAAGVKPQSVAYPTAAFHVVEARKSSLPADKIRALLEQTLSNLQRYPRPVQNAFRHERMLLAKDYADYLKYAPRYPAALSDDSGAPASEWPKEYPDVLLDADAAAILNRYLPLSLFQQSASSPSWTDHLRIRAARAAWTRAILTDQYAIAAQLSPVLTKSYPETKELFDAVGRSNDATEKKFAAIYAMLKIPAMSPVLRTQLDRDGKITEMDTLRDNWWCGAAKETAQDKQPEPKPAWITSEMEKTSEGEWKRMLAPGAAANYFTPIVIDWAQAHKDDPRSPEALHLVVESTRIGCRDEKTGANSKRAHALLQKLFPNSSWTKKTKYWYAL